VTALAACAALAAVAIGAPPKARYELPADEPDSQPNRVSTRADVLRAKRAYLIEAPEEPEPREDAAAPNTEAPQLAIQTDEAASPTEPATARDTSRKNCSELGWATQVTERTHVHSIGSLCHFIITLCCSSLVLWVQTWASPRCRRVPRARWCAHHMTLLGAMLAVMMCISIYSHLGQSAIVQLPRCGCTRSKTAFSRLSPSASAFFPRTQILADGTTLDVCSSSVIHGMLHSAS